MSTARVGGTAPALPAWRAAWVPPVVALAVGCGLAVFLPFGIGILISTVIPLCVLAMGSGFLATLALRRAGLSRLGATIAYVLTWVAVSILTVVAGTLVLALSDITQDSVPLPQRILLDLANAPIAAALLVTLSVASALIIRRD